MSTEDQNDRWLRAAEEKERKERANREREDRQITEKSATRTREIQKEREQTRFREYKAAKVEAERGRTGLTTTVVSPVYQDKGAGPEIDYSFMGRMHRAREVAGGIWRNTKEVTSNALHTGAGVVAAAPAAATQAVNDKLVDIGWKAPPPKTAAEQIAQRDRFQPVGGLYLGNLQTSAQADRYFDEQRKKKIEQEARQDAEERYHESQLHGNNSQSFEEFLKHGAKNIEMQSVRATDGTIRQVQVYKEFPALVEAGGASLPETRGVNPGDRFWLTRERIEKDSKTVEVLEKAPLKQVKAVTAGLVLLGRYNSARNDELGRQIGVLRADEGEHVQNIIVDISREHVAKPASKKLVSNICSKHLPKTVMLSPQMCETIGEALFEGAIDETSDTLKK